MANAENIKNNDLDPVTGRNEDTPHIINAADLSSRCISNVKEMISFNIIFTFLYTGSGISGLPTDNIVRPEGRIAKCGCMVSSGDNYFNQNPANAKKLWRRPLDITRVIDSVIHSPGLFGKTDKGRIAALGHSLGGWTVMSLAGARFEPLRFLHDCRQQPHRGDCKLKDKLGIDNEVARAKLSADNRDARIQRSRFL